MSIRDADKARERQQNQRAARRGKEAEARPDAVHRAVVFLLRAAMENNPDLAEEAKHHITTLDNELADLSKVAEIEKPAGSPAVPAAAEPAADDTEAPKAPDTAKAIKQSKRFQRG